MTFPRKDMSKVCSLCVTFNASDGSIGIYHVKAPSRTTTFGKTQLARNQKRRYGSITTPNPSRILEEENGTEPLHSISLNMEKKRTSTLLSDISSVEECPVTATVCHKIFQGLRRT